MLNEDKQLMNSVDTLLHFNDLARYCDVSKIARLDAILMGARFIHTFCDAPAIKTPLIKNHNYVTRLKMLNVQL